MASIAVPGPVKFDDDKIPAEVPPWTFRNYAPNDSEDEPVTDEPAGAGLTHWVATGYMRQAEKAAATNCTDNLFEWNGNPVNARWIDEEGIDSSTLLSVVLQFIDIYGPQPLAHTLPLKCITHTSHYSGLGIPMTQPSRYIRDEECTDQECIRCRASQGGYKFKWMAAEWFRAYVHHMRVVWADRTQPDWHLKAARGGEYPQGSGAAARMM